MYIGINRDTLIAEIQKEFNDQYPYLKIEFFKDKSFQDKLPRKLEKINPKENVSRITRFYKPGSIHVDKNRTVAHLVGDFWEMFGLAVQVFRKSGNSWIETSLTDDWSLEKQNNIGQSFSITDGKV